MIEKELIAIVGKTNVSTAPDILDAYAGDLSFAARVRPRCVVRPKDGEEVQRVVKWANETRTPIVPISSGPPHFNGDTIPKMGGSVILDLSRMKKIMHTDWRHRVAWVEPGVTFAELQPELAKQGLSAYLPLCPRGSKSVLASILDREPITMPTHHWDATDPYLCAEVIFGTGDRMRTGEAAGPGSPEEQWSFGKAHMTPFGLSQMDENKLLSGSQGSFGILTWASFKVREASKSNRTLLIGSDKLTPLYELIYKVLRIRQCDNCFIVNDLNLATLTQLEPGKIEALRSKLPAWILVISFEGNGELPEEKISWMEADFLEMVSDAGLQAESMMAGLSAGEVAEVLAHPSDEPYWKLRYKSGNSDLFFLTTLDKSGEFVNSVNALCNERRFSTKDVGVYLQPVVQGTSCHCEFNFYHDPSNAMDSKRAQWMITEGAANLSNKGAFFARPRGSWSKIAFNRSTESISMLKGLKNIFDPNEIMNPGQLCF